MAMQRAKKDLTGSYQKVSDGACHVQVRFGSGIGRFIATADGTPDDDDKAYLQLVSMDWPGPEPLYVRAEGKPGEIVVWEDV